MIDGLTARRAGADTSFHPARFNGPRSFKGARCRGLGRLGSGGARMGANPDFSDVKAASAIDLGGGAKVGGCARS